MKIVISANFEAHGIVSPLKWWCDKNQIATDVVALPATQVIQHLLESSSPLHGTDTVAVLLLDLVRWTRLCFTAVETNDLLAELVAAIRAFVQRGDTGGIMLAISPNIRQFHDLDATMLECTVRSMISDISAICLVTTDELFCHYPFNETEKYFDRHADALADLPYTYLGFASLATMVARKLYLLIAPPKKVIVTDCDNTIWRGVAGENDIDDLVVDLGRSTVQALLAEQVKSGKLLYLCSRNNEADTIAVLKSHKGMILRPEHITGWQINWGTKSGNIQQILSACSMTADEMIFLDDDPIECAEVRSVFPSACVIHVPLDPYDVKRTLDSVWAFDSTASTDEDQGRIAYYRQAVGRAAASKTISLEEFLDGLNLEATFAKMTQDDVSRASELSFRVNQFNLNGIRHRVAELSRLSREVECWLLGARDRFGDYGRVGLLIYGVKAQSLVVKSWLLSCRALGKRIEDRMYSHLQSAAKSAGKTCLEFEFLETGRNEPMRLYLERQGAMMGGSRECHPVSG